MVATTASGAEQSGKQSPASPGKDVVYKSTPQGDLCLDLYYPPDKSRSRLHPLVVYTHGGGWAAGSKNSARSGTNMGRVIQALTERGFCVASVDYRLCRKDGAVTIRDCVTDAKDAVRYLSKNSDQYGVDPNRVFTFGDSAGGQIAQMLLLSPPDSLPGAPELAGADYRMIAGVSWYGPCDFEKTELFRSGDKAQVRDRFAARICGRDTDPGSKLQLYREISPVNYLRKDSPPLLMIQGDKDTTIPVHHALYMEEKAAAAGAPVETVIVANAGHNWREAQKGVAIEPGVSDIVQRTVDFLGSR